MSNPKGNEYGKLPQYEPGDSVRIWPIHKNPIGLIERIVDADSFPIKYMIRYTYFEGGTFLEQFGEDDLTLYERRSTWGCNCKTCSERHSDWCNTIYNRNSWRR